MEDTLFIYSINIGNQDWNLDAHLYSLPVLTYSVIRVYWIGQLSGSVTRLHFWEWCFSWMWVGRRLLVATTRMRHKLFPVRRDSMSSVTWEGLARSSQIGTCTEYTVRYNNTDSNYGNVSVVSDALMSSSGIIRMLPQLLQLVAYSSIATNKNKKDITLGRNWIFVPAFSSR